jgi:hypothetical protein
VTCSRSPTRAGIGGACWLHVRAHPEQEFAKTDKQPGPQGLAYNLTTVVPIERSVEDALIVEHAAAMRPDAGQAD